MNPQVFDHIILPHLCSAISVYCVFYVSLIYVKAPVKLKTFQFVALMPNISMLTHQTGMNVWLIH